jgi:hypothetical protein
MISARWISVVVIAVAAIGIIPGHHSGPTFLSPASAEAQNLGQRVIQGKVFNDASAPASGATVFLKNVKNRNVKSFTSIADGSFRFAQVGMADDYEVWAELGSKKSGVKAVSSFDSRKQVEFDLKLK